MTNKILFENETHLEYEYRGIPIHLNKKTKLASISGDSKFVYLAGLAEKYLGLDATKSTEKLNIIQGSAETIEKGIDKILDSKRLSHKAGQGWHENKNSETGIAQRHHDVQVQGKNKGLMDRGILPSARSIPASTKVNETFGMDLGKFEIRRYRYSSSHRELPPTYFISSVHKPEARIYGIQASPLFRKLPKMKEFWSKYGTKIKADYDENSIEQFKVTVEKIIKDYIKQKWEKS